MDDQIKLAWRTVGLDDPRVQTHLTAATDRHSSVMLHRDDRPTRRGRGSHYRPHRDGAGWYIRTGKRGTNKEYLTACEITFNDGKPLLFQFRTTAQG